MKNIDLGSNCNDSPPNRRQRTRVVVFDSDEMVARRLARSLASTVSRTYWTTSFKQAMQLIAEKRANVLVSDCQAGESTSVTFLARCHAKFPDVAIVAMSRLPDDKPQAIAAGACAFLYKPVRTSKLTEAINRVREERSAKAHSDTSDQGLLSPPARLGLRIS